MANEKIVLHVLTMDDPEDLLRILSITYGHFDAVRICAGCKSDTIVRLCKGFDAQYFYREWTDDFSEQKNFLLDQSTEGEYIFQLDIDEVPEVAFLENMRSLIDGVERTIWLGRGILVQNGKPQYTDKQLLNKELRGKLFAKKIIIHNTDNVRFFNKTHPSVLAYIERQNIPNWQVIETTYLYWHYKTPLSFILGDLRSGFMNPIYQGFTEEEGEELRGHFAMYNITDWRSQVAFLEAGDIPADLKEYIIENRFHRTLKSWFWFYFCLHHPEELQIARPGFLSTPPDKAVFDFLITYSGFDRVMDNRYIYINHLRLPDIYKKIYGAKVTFPDKQ